MLGRGSNQRSFTACDIAVSRATVRRVATEGACRYHPRSLSVIFTVNLKVDTAPLFQRFEHPERKLGFAIVQSLNRLGEIVQGAEIEHEGAVLTIRKPTLFFGSSGRPGGVGAKLFRATNAKPYTDIVVEDKLASGSHGPTFLSVFESGGLRRPTKPGATTVAEPVIGGPARPSFAQPVPTPFYIQNLRLVATRQGKALRTKSGKLRRRRGAVLFSAAVAGTGTVQIKGTHRTFLLERARNLPHGAVFQRYGPARGDVKLVYAFDPPPQLDARLRFVETALPVIAEWWPILMSVAVADAFAHELNR